MNIIFITGNQGKADFLARHIKYPINHRRVDLEEIQSLNLRQIAEHKARQAFDKVGDPVLIEDVSLVFEALGKLPGPFIKWFELSLGLDGLCGSLDGKSRKAIASVCFVFYDGKEARFFEGEMRGSIAPKPTGENGFGFDPIFVREGHTKTLAQMSDDELENFSLRTTTVYPELKKFLANIDKP